MATLVALVSYQRTQPRMESDHVWLFYLSLPHFIWNIPAMVVFGKAIKGFGGMKRY